MPTIKPSKRPVWLGKREVQGRRKTDNQKFYNSQRWRKLRKRFLKENPLCVECEKVELIRGADMVDHIKTIGEGGARFDLNNLQPLCHHHHNIKSGKEAHTKK
jgi:5-methylcytosine-specific restriction protein A